MLTPFPASLFASYPEQANTLSLLYEVSREITSILDREELLRRVAQRVKKARQLPRFSVMLWNEKTQHLESAFACAMATPSPHARAFRSTKDLPEPPRASAALSASPTRSRILAFSAAKSKPV